MFSIAQNYTTPPLNGCLGIFSANLITRPGTNYLRNRSKNRRTNFSIEKLETTESFSRQPRGGSHRALFVSHTHTNTVCPSSPLSPISICFCGGAKLVKIKKKSRLLMKCVAIVLENYAIYHLPSTVGIMEVFLESMESQKQVIFTQFVYPQRKRARGQGPMWAEKGKFLFYIYYLQLALCLPADEIRGFACSVWIVLWYLQWVKLPNSANTELLVKASKRLCDMLNEIPTFALLQIPCVYHDYLNKNPWAPFDYDFIIKANPWTNTNWCSER